MGLFEDLRSELAAEADSAEDRLLADRLVCSLEDSLLGPIGRIFGASVVVLALFAATLILDHSPTPGSISLTVLTWVVLMNVHAEIQSFKLISLVVKSIGGDQKKAYPQQSKYSFGFAALAGTSELIGWSFVIPIAVSAPFLFNGEVLKGLAPQMYFLIAGAGLSCAFWIIFRRQAAGGIAILFIPASFAMVAIPAWLMNLLLSDRADLWDATSAAATVSLGLGVAVLAAFLVLSAGYLFLLGPFFMRILPVRRSERAWPMRLRGSIRFMESEILLHGGSVIVAMPALAPLVYGLQRLDHSLTAFLALNLYVSAHIAVMRIAYFRTMPRSDLRILRRAGAQATAIHLVLVNAVAVAGYTAGWIASQTYFRPGWDIDSLPFPGLMYALHWQSPLSLPYAAQIEAAVLTILLVLVVTWVQIVWAKKAWGEAILVLGGSLAAALSPYFAPPIADAVSHLLDADWVVVDATPEIVLALIVPAIKAFLSSELELTIDPGVETSDRQENNLSCIACGEEIDPTDQYCRACGERQNLP